MENRLFAYAVTSGEDGCCSAVVASTVDYAERPRGYVPLSRYAPELVDKYHRDGHWYEDAGCTVEIQMQQSRRIRQNE